MATKIELEAQVLELTTKKDELLDEKLAIEIKLEDAGKENLSLIEERRTLLEVISDIAGIVGAVPETPLQETVTNMVEGFKFACAENDAFKEIANCETTVAAMEHFRKLDKVCVSQTEAICLIVEIIGCETIEQAIPKIRELENTETITANLEQTDYDEIIQEVLKATSQETLAGVLEYLTNAKEGALINSEPKNEPELVDALNKIIKLAEKEAGKELDTTQYFVDLAENFGKDSEPVNESDIVAGLNARIAELEADGKAITEEDKEDVPDLEEVLEAICPKKYAENTSVNKLITQLSARAVPGVNQTRIFISPNHESSDIVLADTNYKGCFDQLSQIVAGKHAQVIAYSRNEVTLNFPQSEVLAVLKEAQTK